MEVLDESEIALDPKNLYLIEKLVRFDSIKIDFELDSNYTVFAHGCKYGNEYLVNRGIKEKIPINRVYQDGMTALMLALTSKNTEVVKLLLKLNPNIQIVDSEGDNALTIAAKNIDDVSIIKNIESLGADIDRKSTRLNSSHLRLSRMPSSA